MAARRRPSVDGSDAPGSLVPICKNVTVDGRRTSVRMEPMLWESLQEICRREDKRQNDIVALVDERRGNSGLTAALRVFIIAYFKRAVDSDNRLKVGFAEDGASDGLLAKAMTIFDAEMVPLPPGADSDPFEDFDY